MTNHDTTSATVSWIDRLRRFAAGTEMVDDRAWLAEGVETYLALASDGMGLEAALGITAGPGQCPWWVVERRALRDGLVRRFAAASFPRDSPRAHAKLVSAAISAYRSTSWPRDIRNGLASCYAGTPRELLFEAFSVADGNMPSSVKQITSILGEGNQIGDFISRHRIDTHRQGRTP